MGIEVNISLFDYSNFYLEKSIKVLKHQTESKRLFMILLRLRLSFNNYLQLRNILWSMWHNSKFSSLYVIQMRLTWYVFGHYSQSFVL